ncbi:MAG TPA: CDP-glucose 4,6-dehydratase [Spirochaetota bacterium]
MNNFYKGKKVFITGHTGFKGSWLCLWLESMGAQVTGFALEPPTDPSLFNKCGLAKGMKSIIGDVRDLQALSKAMNDAKPEIVIHMAAQPLVRDSYKIPVETYAVNVMGTVHLLEAVRLCDSVRAVVNVTTDKCYDNKEWVWGYRETEPMGGYDPYSNSKGCSELVTSSYRSSFFNPKDYGKTHHVALASARAGNVIGGGDWATDRLIPDIVRSIMNGKTVQIRSPHAIRPWQHVLEPLSGYLLLAKNLYEKGIEYAEGWNFGPNDEDAKPVEWIVRKMCDMWGHGARYEIDKKPQPHEANYLKLDCSKAKARMEWYPRWSLDVAIEKIIVWTKAYQQNGDLRAMCLNQIAEYTES